MTIDKLSQLQHLNGEIRMLRSQLRKLREDRCKHTVVDAVQASSYCVPYQLHTEVIAGIGPSAQAQALSEAIAKRKAQLAETLLCRERELLELEGYIAGIEDSLTRQIFLLRYVEGLSWQQVAARVNGSEASVKMAVKRYLANS